MTTTWRAHRRVLGVSGDVEVLACGHRVPRYEGSEGFARLTERGWPAFPRLRVCPECPAEETVIPAAFAEVPAPPEAALWWARLGLPERGAWLDRLAPGEEVPLLRSRVGRTPLPDHERDRLGEVLRAAQAEAAEVGLTLRELSSCSAAPLPVLGGWALTRAAARRHEAGQAGEG
ncbi:hypothetical protein DAETH_40430 (plasmid) [Deinococcus aetherius]|uniref:Uncharacterized protein n=1 Tax=Deinococcus aetherius TaxID=200252 RepID=A0ABN6RMI4_9DEIO|nr:hypothetical protein [Deinococcus aetherius]BDP44074.1 hypothetical protein DAETH_40430 [Deinococcus aetherius]